MNKVAIAVSATLIPFAATAAPNDQPGAPGYTYVQGDYIPDGDADGTGNDYDGYGVEGSVTITRHVFVNGKYDWLDVDGSSLEANRASVGVGLNDFFDYGGAEGTGIGYYGQVSYERLALDGINGGDEADANGYGADAGLRWMATPRVEINPHIGWVDYGDVEDDVNLGDADGIRYGVRALGHVTDELALTASYSASEVETARRDIGFDNEFRVGARMNF
ncbi:porin [Salinisphaera dokdonensis CL-ES53]|uniref:Porin n=1 Tax=Salinisphaera dokdonensis CL-ES53 TaxID=1304272 RepID=A0ABV2AXV7_9GAMM